MRKSSYLLLSAGSSLLITQIKPNESRTRFERKVYALTVGENNTYIKVRFDKLIPAEYGLSKRRALYFFPDTARWRGVLYSDRYFDAEEQLTFKVEVIGMRYLTQPEMFKELGLSISGFDLRYLFFEKFFGICGLPNMLPDGTAMRFVDTKGDTLRVFAKDMLSKWSDLFTIEEQLMIAEYLKQD
ncbi:MAG: hypothetical protein NUV49_01760 [Patescibacteria group bacterium]|nr:hypothetical protein [Patescibacteria group bacterium]